MKPGEWLMVEHVIFFDSVPGNVWQAENLQKVTYKGIVRRKSKDELTMVFKPVHFFESQLSKGVRSQYYNYYNSYYADDNRVRDEYRRFPRWRSNDSIGQVFTDAQANDSMVVKISLPNGMIKDTTFMLVSGNWTYPIAMSDIGFNFKYSFSYGAFFQIINARTLFTHTVVEYLNKWRLAGAMPMIIHPVEKMPEIVGDKFRWMMRSREKTSSLVRVAGASFDLPPNLCLVYTTKESLPEKDLEFSVEGKKYRFVKQKNGSLQCRFFLSTPQKTMFDGITLLLTPGDSITFQKDDTGVCAFSGRGAANCRFAQEKAKLSRAYPKGYDYFVDGPSLEDVNRRVTNVRNIYQTAWSHNEKGMNDYWLTSSQLSCKYWEMSIWLKRAAAMYSRGTDGLAVIPWDSASFATVAPYLDYLYQPEGYEKFINSYYNYKVSQLVSDNLNAIPMIYMWDDATETYYLQKQLLKDYPCFIQTKNTLEKIMKQKHLANCQREYQDFMQACREPLVRDEIEELRGQLQKLEPDAKIQDLGFGLEKFLSLKDKPDGYIMLSFKQGGFEWDKSWMSNLRKVVQESKQNDKVRISALRLAGYKESLPGYMENSDDYVFVPAGITQKGLIDMDVLGIDFVLISNDGTIISREINSNFWDMPLLIKSSPSKSTK